MKVLGIKQFHQKTFEYLPLDDSPMSGILGKLPQGAVICIKGASGNGKTEFEVQLCKELNKIGQKIDILHYEQGHGADFQMATMRNNMEEYSGLIFPINPWDNVPAGKTLLQDCIDKYYDGQKGKLRRNAPDWVVFDSWDDTGFNYQDYKLIKNLFRGKVGMIIIMRSRKSGAIIKKVCDDIAFDGQMTLFVSNFIAYPEKSRVGGKDAYVIYEDEAMKRNPVFFRKQVEQGKSKKGKPKRSKKTPTPPVGHPSEEGNYTPPPTATPVTPSVPDGTPPPREDKKGGKPAPQGDLMAVERMKDEVEKSVKGKVKS